MKIDSKPELQTTDKLRAKRRHEKRERKLGNKNEHDAKENYVDRQFDAVWFIK